MLTAPDEHLLEIMAAAYRVRRQYFGNSVQLYFLMNAKSGLCPEDCSYCSQSKVATSEIPRYNLLSREKILAGAQLAYERKSKTYCIVISGRGPNEREIQAVEQMVPEIKARYDLKICACLGLLTAEQAKRLQACGVDRVNHNLNTGPEFYENICTTHTYQDRIDTLHAVRDAGLELCSGGIVGMGERDADVVKMAMELRDLGVNSIPVNFLNPIDGTPLSGSDRLNPRYCLKVLAMFRFVESRPRNPHRRRSGNALGQFAVSGTVCRQLPVCRRLPDHRGTGSRGRLSTDSRHGLYDYPRRGGCCRWGNASDSLQRCRKSHRKSKDTHLGQVEWREWVRCRRLRCHGANGVEVRYGTSRRHTPRASGMA